MTDEEPTSSARRTVPVAAFAIAVIVAAALGVLAVIALSVGGGGDGADEQVDDVRFAAGRFAERLLSWEHDDFDDWLPSVLTLSTGSFAGEVREIESGLRTLAGEGRLDLEARVTDVYVGDVERGTASAVVTYNLEITDDEGTRIDRGRYVRIDLVEIEGQWLADDVIDILTDTPPVSVPGADSGAPAETTIATTTSVAPG